MKDIADKVQSILNKDEYKFTLAEIAEINSYIEQAKYFKKIYDNSFIETADKPSLKSSEKFIKPKAPNGTTHITNARADHVYLKKSCMSDKWCGWFGSLTTDGHENGNWLELVDQNVGVPEPYKKLSHTMNGNVILEILSHGDDHSNDIYCRYGDDAKWRRLDKLLTWHDIKHGGYEFKITTELLNYLQTINE